MNVELVLTNARIVVEDEVIRGSLQIVGGRIADVSTGRARPAGAVDCQGDLVLPGLVELHTDNLEKHFMPRPGVRWPGLAATLAHDGQMVSSGITTIYDAVSLNDAIDSLSRPNNLTAMIDSVTEARRQGWLRADHRLHLRCEVASASVTGIFAAFADNGLVGIVSLMDHTPGQRQFVHEDKYIEYYMGKYGFTAPEMADFTRRQQELSARFAEGNRQALARACRERGHILASHDDATAAHVAEAAGLGTHIAEFPTTPEAARAARQAGMKVLMGAPNLVRGASHSGNVSATDLALAGDLDMLSSDYVPASLLHAAFALHRGPLGLALPAAVAKVSAIPAAVAGLDDRGRIEIGRRADVLRVLDTGDAPVVRAVWREGQRVG
jgi:alpha-D-ribose 1-methylphosphonate 5-triphosphate diphosphatase